MSMREILSLQVRTICEFNDMMGKSKWTMLELVEKVGDDIARYYGIEEAD